MWKCGILDQPVFPDISNLNGHLVSTRLGHIGDVRSEGRLPQNAHRFVIHKQLGDMLDLTEVEVNALAFFEPFLADVNALLIGGRAGEILDALFRASCP